jgi:hypothetical protein
MDGMIGFRREGGVRKGIFVCRQPFVADYTDWSHSCHSAALSDLFFWFGDDVMAWCGYGGI